MFDKLLLLMAASAQFVVPPPPQEPTGRWIVDEVPSGCRARRDYQPSGTTLRLVARPITGTYLLSVDVGHPVALSYGDPVELTLLPGGTSVEAPAIGFPPNMSQPSGFGLYMDAASFTRSADFAIRIATRRERVADLALRDMPAMLSAMNACEGSLLARFGIDPASQATVATPPRSLTNPESWFLSRDYPTKARRAGAQGLVAGRFRVRADGSTTDCVVITSSGDPLLDQTTCKLVMLRARFAPALTKDGRAVASAQIFSTRWTLPGS